MAKPSAAARIIAVPLNQLHVSPRNARPNDKSDVAGLAALLRSQGQLQNMVVHADADGYAVADGGRRLRAFRLLESLGHVKPDHPVWCMVTDDDRALSASIAANSEREAMHPADEFDAFKVLVDGGTPVEDIAAQFGVTPLVVRRRLTLAKVSPKLVAIYRAGDMTLEQLQAFTLTDDHKLQEKVWNSSNAHWERQPHSLREKLTKGAKHTGNDRAARFVGLDAYEAAGGRVVRDLFGAPDSGYIADGELMERLAIEKLEAVAEQLRGEGWSFVKVVPKIHWEVTNPYGRSKPTRRDLTDDEQAEIARLESRSADLGEKLRADSDDELTDGEVHTIENELAKAKARIAEIQSSTETYTDRQKKKAGVVLGIGQNGQLEVHRGMVPPADPKVQKAKEKEKARAAAVERGEPELAGFSEALMRKLTANRTIALAAHLLDCPRVALDLLCTQLATQLIYRGGFYGAAGVHIQPHDQMGSVRNAAGAELENSKALRAVEDKRADLLERLPENPAELFTWLGQQTVVDVIEILCFCTATSLNAIVGSETAQRPLAAVEDAIGLDMADWWQPTVESFLAQVPKAVVVTAMQEAGASEDAIKAAAAAKKADAATLAEAELRDTGWLPGPLRGPHYAMNAAARAKPPAGETPKGKQRTAVRAAPGFVPQAPVGSETKRFAVKVVPAGAPATPAANAPAKKRAPKASAASNPQPVKAALNPAAAWPFPNTDRP